MKKVTNFFCQAFVFYWNFRTNQLEHTVKPFALMICGWTVPVWTMMLHVLSMKNTSSYSYIFYIVYIFI